MFSFNKFKNLFKSEDKEVIPKKIATESEDKAGSPFEETTPKSETKHCKAAKIREINIVSQMGLMKDTIRPAMILAQISTSALSKLDFAIAEYLAYADYLQIHHGPQTATKQLKALNQMVLHYLTQQPVEQLGPVNMKLHKSGLPSCVAKWMPNLTELLHSDELTQKRVALTVLRGFELVRGTPEYDTSTISGVTNGASNYTSVVLDHPLILKRIRGKVFRDQFVDFLEHSRYGRLKRLKYKECYERIVEKNSCSPTSLYYTSKASPRGFAIGTLGLQSIDINPELRKVLCKYADHFGLTSFSAELDFNSRFSSEKKGRIDLNIRSGFYKKLPIGCLGRLCVYPDKGWKHRLMAICNTWIQIALKPAHETLLEVLKSNPCDGTWDQDRAADRVKHATVDKSIGSTDIKDATNTIPALMQEDSLVAMDRVFTNWSILVQSITFYNPEQGEVLQYATGQPMGLYTSFASLAHWHNDIYQFAYFLHKGRYADIFQDYQVLGDDSTCWNTSVLQLYEYLLEILDVPVSVGKSFRPVVPGSKPNVAEFAKRVFVDGTEVTGLSTTLCASVYGKSVDSSLEYMPSLWLTLVAKGWISNPCLFTFAVFKQSIKESSPKVGLKRIQALFCLCKISMMYTLPHYEDSVYNIKDQATIDLLSELMDNKIYDIQSRLGPTWAKVPQLRGELLAKARSELNAESISKHYTETVIDLVLKDLNKLYERCATSIVSQDTLTMLEYIMTYTEVEDVRKFDISHVFAKAKNSGRKTKREKAQSALYRLIYSTKFQ